MLRRADIPCRRTGAEADAAMMDETAMGVPLDSIAYRFDIVLRGRRSTMFENRLEGN